MAEGLRRQYVNHTPSDAGKSHIELLRLTADGMHTAIESLVPNCRERSLALTKLEECVMWVVKGVVLNDPEAVPAQPVAK
jgi:hypothetical protein